MSESKNEEKWVHVKEVFNGKRETAEAAAVNDCLLCKTPGISEGMVLSLLLSALFVLVYGILITLLSTGSPMYFGNLDSCDASLYTSGQPFPPVSETFYWNTNHMDANNWSPDNWYTGEYGWDFMTTRGICPLGAVQVWIETNGEITFEGSYAEYSKEQGILRRALSSGETTISPSSSSWASAKASSLQEVAYDAGYGVMLAYKTLSDLIKEGWEVVANSNAAKARRIAQGVPESAIPAPQHHIRKLSSSDSDDKSIYFNYRYCIRSENKKYSSELFKDIDIENGKNGVPSTMLQGWDDWVMFHQLVKIFMIYTWCVLLFYLYMSRAAIKYSYAKSLRLMNAAVFPHAACLAMDVAFIAVSLKISTLLDKSPWLTPENSNADVWNPMFPTCKVTVETASGNRINRAVLSFGIILLFFRLMLISHWIYTRFLKAVNEEEHHSLQLEEVDANVEYKRPKYYKELKKREEEAELIEKKER